MKERFTFLDIRAIVNELNPKLLNKFIQNIYTTSQRIFYIKFSSKDILLIEPGVRIHLTSEHDTEISHFCKILRKRTRRDKVQKIHQLGFDRIVILELMRQTIVIEFFSGGNIFILEDGVIVEVFRIVRDLNIVKGERYFSNPVQFDFSFRRFVECNFEEFLPFEDFLVKQVIEKLSSAVGEGITDFRNRVVNTKKMNGKTTKTLSEKVNDEISDTMEVLTNSNVLSACIDPKSGIALEDREKVDKFDAIMSGFDKFIQGIGGTGVVTYKKKKIEGFFPFDPFSDSRINNLATDDASLAENTSIDKASTSNTSNTFVSTRFSTFNEAVDSFYLLKKPIKFKETKVSKVRARQLQYIDEMEKKAQEYENVATVIQMKDKLINDIIRIHKTAVKHKMKWEDFEKFKQHENSKGNEVSRAIVKTDFVNGRCLVRVAKSFLDMQDANNEELPNTVEMEPTEQDYYTIDLDYNVSSFANATKYYQKKKKILEKIQKTRSALETVLSKIAPKQEIKKVKRVPYWFEKFHFFFSSDNCLVIGGKNAQQNEILVKKYLDLSDLYFHGDVHGCSSIIVKSESLMKSDFLGKGNNGLFRLDVTRNDDMKNGETKIIDTNDTGLLVPSNTIDEAAAMALCMSNCWEQNVVNSVWYVKAEQVSKSAPTGEYLTKGAFLIRGKKNYVESYRLEYGLGILFRLEDDKPNDENKMIGVKGSDEKDDLCVGMTTNCIPTSGSFNLRDVSASLELQTSIPFHLFVSEPKGREIRHAMLICAPWRVISKYKYRVKLLPGKEKKGKLVQRISKKFIEEANDSEVSYVMSISVEEYMNVLINNVKIGKE